MCSACIHLIVIRPPDDWCICGGVFLVRFSSWSLVSTSNVKMVRISPHLHAIKNVIDANDKYFHFTLCFPPVLSALPCPTQGPTGRLAPFERAVVVVTSCWATAKKYCEGLHGWKDYPYIGYGHQLQWGEHLSSNMTEWQADSLLRADLWKCVEHFKDYGKDALLLTLLGYNVGVGR